MRIIVPYFPEVSSETREALKKYDVEYIELDNGLGYYNLLKGIWENPEDIILIEHDIIPWDGAIEQLIDSKEPWCGYNYDEGKAVMFGCVKLTAEHMAQVPDLWDSMLLRNWRNVHGHHGNTYLEHGIYPTQLYPAVINLSLIREQVEDVDKAVAAKIAERPVKSEVTILKELLQAKGVITKADLDQAASADVLGG